MISRETNTARINEIINHPSIYPWISGPVTSRLDFSELVSSGAYIALFGEYGGFLFWKLAPGIYDAHSAILPDGRGKWALDAAREALRLMFADTGALEIMMAAPKGNLAVRALIRNLKARHLGRIEDGWWLNGRAVPSDIYSLTKMDWERCRLPQ